MNGSGTELRLVASLIDPPIEIVELRTDLGAIVIRQISAMYAILSRLPALDFAELLRETRGILRLE